MCCEGTKTQCWYRNDAFFNQWHVKKQTSVNNWEVFDVILGNKPSSYVLTLQLWSGGGGVIIKKRTWKNWAKMSFFKNQRHELRWYEMSVFDARQSCGRRRVAKWEQHEKLPQNSCCTKTEAIESEERNEHLRAEILCRRDDWKTEGGKNIHSPSFFFLTAEEKLMKSSKLT